MKEKDPIQSLTEKGFLKTSSSLPISSEDKVKLNLKGNQLMNQGAVQQAQKIFLTTHYSDGLCRLGDFYQENKDPVNALKFYTISGRKDKSEPLVESIVQVIRAVLKEDEKKSTI